MNFRFVGRIAASLTLRTALFAALWWMLTEGAAGSWAIGAPAVLIAAAVSTALIPQINLVWSEIPRFVPFFLARSLLGGADVARRALHPSLPIFPALVDYPLKLPTGLPRVIMINIVSLLPGTLSVEAAEDRLTVHVIDGRKDCLTELNIVESRVARLFAVTLPAAEGGTRDETIQEHSLRD